MALINCPECQKQVSDKAYACPNCGFPIREYFENNQDAVIQNNTKNMSEKDIDNYTPKTVTPTEVEDVDTYIEEPANSKIIEEKNFTLSTGIHSTNENKRICAIVSKEFSELEKQYNGKLMERIKKDKHKDPFVLIPESIRKIILFYNSKHEWPEERSRKMIFNYYEPIIWEAKRIIYNITGDEDPFGYWDNVVRKCLASLFENMKRGYYRCGQTIKSFMADLEAVKRAQREPVQVIDRVYSTSLLGLLANKFFAAAANGIAQGNARYAEQRMIADRQKKLILQLLM